MHYDLNLELVKKEVAELRKKLAAAPGVELRSALPTVLIQLPAGLRTQTLDVARAIISAGGEPLVWAGSCYGACDLPQGVKADLFIHFGHSKFKF